MKKYWLYLKFEWQLFFEYRGTIFIYTVSSMVVPLIGLAIWLAVSSAGVNLKFSQSELIIYFLLTIFVSNFTSAWAAPYLAEKINNGHFSTYLIRPFSFVLATAVGNIAEKIYKLAIIIFASIFVIYFYVGDFSFSFELLKIVLFILSLIMGSIIFYLLDISIGLTAFWTTDILFLRNHYLVLNQFLSGRFIPLAFFPANVLFFVEILPFRYTTSFPIEILLNKLSTERLWYGFIIQISWVVISIVLYKFMLKNGVKRYQGFGA